MTPTELLREALNDFFQERADIANDAQPMLLRFLEKLKDAQPRTAPAPRTLPATRHWEDIMSSGGIIAFPGLNDALAAMTPLLHWRQNPNYNDGLMGAGYMDNYGYAEFVGGDGSFLDAEAIRCGILLIGPHRHYPKHHHAAEEVYCVLSSAESQWRRGEEDWRSYALGTPIYHASWMKHETKTDRDPLIALYCWYGDATSAVLVSSL